MTDLLLRDITDIEPLFVRYSEHVLGKLGPTGWMKTIEAIEAAIKDVESVLRDGDKDVITAKTEALSQAAMKLGEKMYADMQAQEAANAAAGGAAGADQAGGSKPADDNVVDAEVKEVKDEPKKA